MQKEETAKGLHANNKNEENVDEGLLTTTGDEIPQKQKFTKEFDGKIKNINIGLGTTGKERVPVDFMGVEKDIQHDRIWCPPIHTKEQYKKIREDRIKDKQRRSHEHYGYSVPDDRFHEFENDLCKSDLQEKANFYKKQGVGIKGGHNAARHAFSRRDRHTLQESNTFEKGQDKFKKEHRKRLLYGKQLPDKDEAEEKSNGSYTLVDLPLRRRAKREKVNHGLNFEKVLEWDVRERYHLKFARQRKNVDKYVTQAKNSYTRTIGTGSINNTSGRYRGGFMARSMRDKAQQNNKANGDYEFTVDANKVDIDMYYRDFGNMKNGDVVIDKFEEDQNKGKLKPSGI